MATLKEAIATILADDTTLRTLLDYHATTKPRVVFYQYPPANIALPLVTYRIAGESAFMPRDIYFDIVVWGGDLKAIHDRVYELLHKRTTVSSTDWQIKGILFESSGPELYEEPLKAYFQRARYRIVACKI